MPSESERPISATFDAVARYAIATGKAPISDKVLEVKLDDSWHFWVNGTKLPVEVEQGVTIEPFECYVKFNGWPAANFNPYGGVFAAGEIANEQQFCAALEKAVRDAD